MRDFSSNGFLSTGLLFLPMRGYEMEFEDPKIRLYQVISPHEGL